ncbi:MAG: outer membrane protein transport protein [Duodenibacillus sp.]|nr:outer membrane protein transport protein [Duodenibacillus sp.]
MKNSIKIAAAAAAALVSTSSVHAAGFMLSEQSVAGLGRAYAGAGIVGDDLSAVWYNPAGMVLLPGTQVQAGGVYVDLDLSYKGDDGTTENGSKYGVPIPNFFFTRQMNDSMWFGLGLTVPYGLATEYNRTWGQINRGMNAEIKVFDLNPNIAWKISDKLSIGAGISLQYADAQYETGVMGGMGYGRLDVDSFAWGANIGVMWSPTETLRFGLSYRSQVNHHADGDLRVGLAGGDNRSYIGEFSNASASLSAPQTVLLTGTWEATPQLRLSALIRWADWSSFDTLTVEVDPQSASNPVLGALIREPIAVENKWQDTWLFTIGADYVINNAWTVRAGVGYETSPIDDESRRTALIPDSERLWLSIGATWHVTENLQGDFGFTWLHGVGDAPLYDKPDGKRVGEFDTLDAYLFGAQMVYRF